VKHVLFFIDILKKGSSQFKKEIEEIKWGFKPLDDNHKVIFKLKRNEKKLIDG
jgi:hypothetical protein